MIIEVNHGVLVIGLDDGACAERRVLDSLAEFPGHRADATTQQAECCSTLVERGSLCQMLFYPARLVFASSREWSWRRSSLAFNITVSPDRHIAA